MALIDGYGEPRNRNVYADPGYQRYLAYLETTVNGEPGRPRATPEPFIVQEASELVDGPVVAPEPVKAKRRKRQQPKPEELEPRRNIELARYARKLKGQE